MTEWNTPEGEEVLMAARPGFVSASRNLAAALRRGEPLFGTTEADMRMRWLSGDAEARGAEVGLDGAAPLLGLASVVLRTDGTALRLVRTSLDGAVTEAWELALAEPADEDARANWLGTWERVAGFDADLPSRAAGSPDEVAGAVDSLTERLLWVLGGTR